MGNRYRVRLREPVRKPEAMSTSFALLTSLRMTPSGIVRRSEVLRAACEKETCGIKSWGDRCPHEPYGDARRRCAGRGGQRDRRRAGAFAISGVPRRYRDSP